MSSSVVIDGIILAVFLAVTIAGLAHSHWGRRWDRVDRWLYAGFVGLVWPWIIATTFIPAIPDWVSLAVWTTAMVLFAVFLTRSWRQLQTAQRQHDELMAQFDRERDADTGGAA